MTRLLLAAAFLAIPALAEPCTQPRTIAAVVDALYDVHVPAAARQDFTRAQLAQAVRLEHPQRAGAAPAGGDACRATVSVSTRRGLHPAVDTYLQRKYAAAPAALAQVRARLVGDGDARRYVFQTTYTVQGASVDVSRPDAVDSLMLQGLVQGAP